MVSEEDLEEEVDRRLLWAALARLSPREKRIVEMRFGLKEQPPRTQKQVADAMGISQSYISRLEKRIMDRLKREILKMQGYRIIYSVITSDNQGSIEFHKKLGYTFVAEFPGCGHKFGRRLGTIWLEKQVDFVEYPQNLPTPCRGIVESDENLCDILDKLSIS